MPSSKRSPDRRILSVRSEERTQVLHLTLGFHVGGDSSPLHKVLALGTSEDFFFGGRRNDSVEEGV